MNMFWILRRTGAVKLFNSLNNNCTSKVNNNNNIDNKRPPRRAYGRLSVDSDDTIPMKNNLDGGGGGGVGGGGIYHRNNETNDCDLMNDRKTFNKDIEGNLMTGDDDDDDDSDIELNCTSERHMIQRQNKELNENTISRLQAIAMSEDEDYDESLTCNVCDRAFTCHRQLASHQQKKRHFGCSGCDSLFPSLMLLEHHKEEFEHWSDDEDYRRPCCRHNRGDDFTDTDSITSEAESEDLERLL